MTIDTRDKIVAGLTTFGQPFNIWKATQTAEGAGTWHSMWKAAGNPTAGATPPAFGAGSGYVPTRATTGALGQADETGGRALHALLSSLKSSAQCTIIVADRLWACSGFGTVVTTAQNIVTPGTLPAARDPYGGGDVEPWLEVYTAPGATGATWTVTGQDSASVAGRTWTYTHPANAESVGQMMPLTPGGATPGLLGMEIPASFTASVSSGTAGDVGLTLIRRLFEVPVLAANVAEPMDAFRLGLARVYPGACLMFIAACTGTATGSLQGHLNVGEG